MPSAMANESVRMWSAMTRKATSSFSCCVSPIEPAAGRVEPYFLPESSSRRRKSGVKTSLS